MTEEQIQSNRTYLSLLEHALSLESYLYSYEYDITHTLQRLENTSPDFKNMPLAERADNRFVWNQHLLKDLQREELFRFAIPIMLGFIQIKKITVKTNIFNYILISRRSSYRAGTRFNMRGLDLEGNAANYVETEQILEYEGSKTSFVQTRGSIPLIWSQKPTLQYKPNPKISEITDHSKAFQKHFANEFYGYGHQVLVNLIDQKGSEKKLEETFRKYASESSNLDIRYEAFDFHSECSKMRWHRLSILLDRLETDRKNFQYFSTDKDRRVLTVQSGIFRTNCIDCLDRTNVVQSLLAKRSLQEQLEKLNILVIGEQIENYSVFESIFRNIWADNADAVSKQYAGTGALKTDYTRSGKRTRMGLLKDGMNSAIRYVKNNFYDGFRQDSMDLVLGRYRVEEDECTVKTCPLTTNRDMKFYILPAIFSVAFSMFLITLLFFGERVLEQMLYLFFWALSTIITGAFIYYYGIEFVDKPKLVENKDKLD